MPQSAPDYFDLLELFAIIFWLIKGQLAKLGDSWQLYPKKCISAGASSSAFRSIVFGTPLCFLALWLCELLYIYLYRLI